MHRYVVRVGITFFPLSRGFSSIIIFVFFCGRPYIFFLMGGGGGAA